MSRRRWRWNTETQLLEEIGADWEPTVRIELMTDSHYADLRAPDEKKTNIGSRTKHREYMQARGLAMADDFKETWAKAAAERERASKGDFEMPGLRDTIGRALYQEERKRRK